ncbi:MAG: ATP-dependent zinc metalloprotease FtsH, partial [Alphaproteobacteria bacterium]|nr:ATP-dependent zinc metalloprotease FtsH [Alphaproteobacteria bacterium]
MRFAGCNRIGVLGLLLVVGLVSATPAAAQWAADYPQWTDAKVGEGDADGPSGPAGSTVISYSDLVAGVDADKVRSVTIDHNAISGEFKKGGTFRASIPNDPNLVARLMAHHVEITSAPDDSLTPWDAMAIEVGTLLLLLGLAFYIGAEWHGEHSDHAGGQPINVGRTNARVFDKPGHRVTFAEVAGIDDAQQELAEIVEFLKAPKKFRQLGGVIPKGCLLVGPPGNGKTLLARAVAGEAGVPFYAMPGSAFVEIYVGMGASRVRDLFDQARKTAPSIVFIDEIDALGHKRGMGVGAGTDERDQTLNQLLVEMDGFASNDGVIILAATNRPDVLDPALLRPGRFDRQVAVSNPDGRGREQILRVHLRDVPLAPDVDCAVLARSTPGFSGADLANLVNEAALMAARNDRPAVGMAEFEASRDKILMGPERRSLSVAPEERQMAAYRQAGRALVAAYTPSCDPVHSVTIVPRANALGTVVSWPAHDRLGVSRQQLEARIAVLLAGRVAEELVFGMDRVTTASAGDLQQASDLARRMVGAFGFGRKAGPIRYGPAGEPVAAFQAGAAAICSQETAACLDEDVRDLLRAGATRARAILAAHPHLLATIAAALLRAGTL